ncbi:hypothetical protein CDD82_5679 [Ophiocordyceps australis]|uniref:Uncharacterized protein n=1 Tax=Ophiocordyceps australis TaxID=1399860 RepID=A0A2C5Z083_9HYPO|nr:hypothetical protein CDD82_5679 [Ophiocordyceps australis]
MARTAQNAAICNPFQPTYNPSSYFDDCVWLPSPPAWPNLASPSCPRPRRPALAVLPSPSCTPRRLSSSRPALGRLLTPKLAAPPLPFTLACQLPADRLVGRCPFLPLALPRPLPLAAAAHS